jgi:hypothetical protein
MACIRLPARQRCLFANYGGMMATNAVNLDALRLGLRREKDYQVDGAPADVDGARTLWEKDEHQFQLWAITLVDGQPRQGGKKGAGRDECPRCEDWSFYHLAEADYRNGKGG